MAKTAELSVLVKVVDRLTAPLRGMQRAFERFGQLAKKIGTIGAAVAGISFAVPIQQAAAFDQKLRDMVVTAGEFGSGAETKIKEIGREMERLALKVGVASNELAIARGYLTSTGLDDTLVSKLMPTIGKVAKAASADALDTAKTTNALADTLAIAADKMELALAKLVVAGKLGRFEFRDMAKELPELSNQMANLGVKGMEAVSSLGAMLQIAMKGTSSPSTAANNLKNFLSKLNAPETLKNFKDAGVDLSKVMADATAKGLNPVEAVIQKIIKLTKIPQKEIDAIFNKAKKEGKTDQQATDEVKKRIEAVLAGSKLGELFKDMQVLDFITPMRLNLEKYLEIKKAIEAADVGVIDRDSKTQMAGLDSQLKEISEVGDQAGRRVGRAFGQNLPQVKALLDWVDSVDAAYPGLIDNILNAAGAVLLLTAALGVIGTASGAVAAGLGVLRIAAVGLMSPVGIVAGVMAGAAVLIWANWGQFAPKFQSMWSGVKQIFSGGVKFISSLFAGDWTGVNAGWEQIKSGFSSFEEGFNGVFASLDKIINDWVKETFGVDIQASIDGAVAWFNSKFDELKALIEGKINEAVAAARKAWDDLSTAANDAFEKIKDAWNRLVDWISSKIPTISWPSPPAWVSRLWGGGDSQAPADGTTAPAQDPMGNPTGAAVGKQSALPSARAVATRAEVGGRIVVSAVGGAKVERVQSDNPTVPLTADRGAVVGRA